MRAIKTMVMLLGLVGWALPGNAAGLPFDAPGEAYHQDGVTVEIASGYSKVWWFATVKVTRVAADKVVSLEGTDAAAFYVNHLGHLMANDGGSFERVNEPATVLADTYVKFAVRLDYDKNCWDLYMGSPLVKQNGNPLAFNATPAQISAVVITGQITQKEVTIEATTVELTPGTPSGTSIAKDVPLILDGGASGLSLQYLGDTVDLQSPQGQALGLLFEAGDSIFVWAGGESFKTCTWDGSDWSPDHTITPTTGFFINRLVTKTSATVAYSTTYSHTTAGSTIQSGWNLLVIPRTATAKTLSNSRLPGAAGDMIFLRSSTGWTIAWHDGSKWTPNITLPSGRPFWLQRRNVSSAPWSSNLL